MAESAGEPGPRVHARFGHDRGLETLAAEVRPFRRFPAGPDRDARRPTREIHPHQCRRRGHPAFGQQPPRRGPAREPLASAEGTALRCAACTCRSRSSPRRAGFRSVAAGGSSRMGRASAPSCAAATTASSVAAAADTFVGVRWREIRVLGRRSASIQACADVLASSVSLPVHLGDPRRCHSMKLVHLPQLAQARSQSICPAIVERVVSQLFSSFAPSLACQPSFRSPRIDEAHPIFGPPAPRR
jgi:hypothetical protein